MNLDGDGPQYISSNTLDEVSHAAFLNAYLESKGAESVNLTSSVSSQEARRRDRQASAASPTSCTSTSAHNRTAIPMTNGDFNDPNHIQVIANIAASHFGYIEQGGSSLYPALSRKASSLEVLKIAQGIGADEIAHFLEWVDFADSGVQAPAAPVTDPQTGFTFPISPPLNPNAPPSSANPNKALIQPSLIFPVRCEFI